MNEKILHTRKFRDKFYECFSRHPRILRVVVPYIGKIPQLPPIVELSRDLLGRGCEEIQLITQPPFAPPTTKERQGFQRGGKLCHGRPALSLEKVGRGGDTPDRHPHARTLLVHEADAISGMEGFTLQILPNLHSKVYQFVFPNGDRAAFVGSANLTMGGLERNIESVAFFCEKEDNDAVAAEIERIAIGAHIYPAWKMYNSKEKK